MAVSSVHEQYETIDDLEIYPNQNQSADANLRFALHQYNVAIASLNGRLSGRNISVEILLMTCLLFVCLEFLRGDQDAAIAHLQSGACILCSFRSQALSAELLSTPPDRHFIEDTFVPIFARLNIVAAFDQPASKLFPKLKSAPVGDPVSAPASFPNLAEARTCLTNLVNLVVEFEIAAEEYRHYMPEDMKVVAKQLKIKAKLHQWSTAFEEFMETSFADMSSEDIRGTTLLRIQHKRRTSAA
jgi:hypothetical protein